MTASDDHINVRLILSQSGRNEGVFSVADRIVGLFLERLAELERLRQSAEILSEVAEEAVVYFKQDNYFACELCGDARDTIADLDKDHRCPIGRAREWVSNG